MVSSSKANQPSLVYVFVVLSLAAFLLLFTIWRDPGIYYETAATFQTKSTPETLRNRLLQPEFVLAALSNAEMISGSSTEEMLRISGDIATRMHVKVTTQGELGQLTLMTSHPKAAIRLLDSMLQEAAALGTDEVTSFAVQPAAIARTRGGSVSPGRLLWLSIFSSAIGFFGVFLAKKARATSLLFTSQEVKEATGIPVIADFVDRATFPTRERQMSRRRLSRVAVRAAELTITAAFIVMIFQLSTRDEFARRFMQDPLAAYGEALTRLHV